MPEGHRIPLWRWLLLPATALMLKHQGGVWMNGTLELTGEDLRFAPVRLIKSAKSPPESWSIPLGQISDVTTVKGIASETIEVHHAIGVAKFMTAKSGTFVEELKQSISDDNFSRTMP